MQSIYERIGDDQAIHGAVIILYAKMMSDPRLRKHFCPMRLNMQESRMTEFLVKLCKREQVDSYDYKLRLAHRKLRLSDEDFDCFIELFKETLNELGIIGQIEHEIVCLLNELRREIVYTPLPVLPVEQEHSEEGWTQ